MFMFYEYHMINDVKYDTFNVHFQSIKWMQCPSHVFFIVYIVFAKDNHYLISDLFFYRPNDFQP